MTDYSTLRVGTTRAWARISTLPIDASQITRAFAIAHAFWSTIWRGTDKIGQTGTRRFIVDRLEYGIGTTLTRSACIFLWWFHSYRNK